MKIGIIGLGKMGTAVGIRLLKGGYLPIGFDTSPIMLQQAAACGITALQTLEDVARHTNFIFIFVPAGPLIDTVMQQLIPVISEETVVIDGGNSFFKDSRRRAELLLKYNVHFLDCGTSGGIHGQENGFCLMIGGSSYAYNKSESIFKAIAAPGGYCHVGPSGAGHYVKMVHNGIEYGLLQAYAEGFNLLHAQKEFASLNLEKIADLWDHGSVIRSWLLGLTVQAFKDHGQQLTTIEGSIQEGGTGRWTLQAAQEYHIPMPVLEKALEVREWSRQEGGNYATALIALIRNQFGGHSFKRKKVNEHN